MLPSLGKITDDNKGSAIQYISGLVIEGRDVRDQMLEQASSCATIYEFGTESMEDVSLVNDSQNAVISSTDIQTKEPPEPTIVPIEHGEGGNTYWNGPQGTIPEQFTKWSSAGDQLPVPQEMIDPLKMSGYERYLVQINDDETSKFATTCFNVYWKRSLVPMFLRKNLLQNNIKGWQWVWYRFDPWMGRHRLQNISSAQVHVDLGVEDVSNASYAIIDVVLPYDECLKLFPELAGYLKEHPPQSGGVPPIFPNGQWGKSDGRNYYRQVVPLRICWLRDQPIPMSEQEALEAELVQQQTIPVEGVQVADDSMAISPQVRQVLVNDQGEEVSHGDENWPARFGIRELIQVGNDIVIDRECQDWDIPLAVNQNIPVLGTLYGYGEPHRIKGLQGAKNRSIRQMVDYGDFYRHPPSLVSQSMKTAMGNLNMVDPGTMISIPDQLYRELNGKAQVFLDLPQIPPAVAQFLPAISQELDKQTQNSPVMQGYAPGGNMSGTAIEALQYSSSSQISFKARSTSEMCYRLCKLMMHAIFTSLDVRQASKIVSQYTPQIVSEFLNRLKTSQYDVEVEILAGSGAAAKVKQQSAIEQYKEGLITKQSAQESLNIDHYKEADREEVEAKKQAALQQSLIPQQPVLPGATQ
jgi:hypothetical protein